MNELMVVDIGRATLLTALKIVTPALVVGMMVGLLVSLFQAVTSLQEQTMTLVPKMLAVALTLIVLLPWILQVLVDFARSMILLMGNLGG
ncbi:MAG TPA: flagellar type III secretion system protein FliQ [Planctomycetes bacterium]|nr:flagellar type III secretion system protein FliQ [Planctomycetota bacterium]